MIVEVDHFTDPACPFAFSAEPVRLRLCWHYGQQLRWRDRMIVLTREPGHAEALAGGAPELARRFAMPIDPRPRSRAASSEPASRAVLAARVHAPAAQERLLRAIRVHTMAGGLVDDPKLIAAAARDAGLDPARLRRWSASARVGRALEEDVRAARDPVAAARALDHKLGGPPRERRYTAPSYVLGPLEGRVVAIAGFNPVEAYEVAIANLAPELVRAPAPGSVVEVLEWAAYPLATAEVASLVGLEHAEARAELARVARPVAAGAEFYWSRSE